MGKLTMDKLVSLCKNRGFIFSGSEIYGGLANTWDYGPLGVELKNNLKKAWWKKFVQQHPHNTGIDSAILMNPSVWQASGHLSGFSDPLMDCKDCKARHRADTLIENYLSKKGDNTTVIAGWDNAKMETFIADNDIKCPVCGNHNFTPLRQFNLMFKTFQGVTEENTNIVYLRPETAQGIFVNFNNVVRSMRLRIPFGIAQMGKSFRNEITPGNFIFRTREFEQMELEFFCKEGTDQEWYNYWKQFCMDWLEDLGIPKNNLRYREHQQEELSHYSKATVDIEFLFPFGWGELWGIANRTDFDLKSHSLASGKSLEYTDPVTQEKYTPYCVEPSVGTDRLVLAFLSNAYQEELLDNNDKRIVLKLHKTLAPIKVAVMPLQKKLSPQATEVYHTIMKHFPAFYDESGSIGRRYRRMDEVGTPYCVTVDFDTLEDNTVTVRERDTMAQTRLAIPELKSFFDEQFDY